MKANSAVSKFARGANEQVVIRKRRARSAQTHPAIARRGRDCQWQARVSDSPVCAVDRLNTVVIYNVMTFLTPRQCHAARPAPRPQTREHELLWEGGGFSSLSRSGDPVWHPLSQGNHVPDANREGGVGGRMEIGTTVTKNATDAEEPTIWQLLQFAGIDAPFPSWLPSSQ